MLSARPGWMGRVGSIAVIVAAFAVLATANSGGYRYGVSDQAFYLPAVEQHIDTSLFPHDAPLIDAQARLMLSDEVVAGLARATRLDLPTLFLALYGFTLLMLALAANTFARAAGFSAWAAVGLLLLLTLRHRIARTGANSLEGYWHPRELAFALGIGALAAIVAGRHLYAWLGILMAYVWHPTTALWFGVAVAAAFVSKRPRKERARWLATGAIIAGLAGWALWLGPLKGRLVVMDSAWLAVLADKDYLFPTAWPAYAWLINLTCPLVVFVIWRLRVGRGVARAGERDLLIGIAALLAVFAISIPLTAAHVALAVQLQVTRVFWVMDFLAAAYLAWLITDGLGSTSRVVRIAVVGLLAAASIARGAYILRDAEPDRRLVAATLPDTMWIEALRWLDRQPASWHVLADPGHAWKYGVSVRIGARKDVLLEQGKDTALAIYDRTVAMRVADRADALAGLERMTASDFRRVARRYQLDVAVFERSQPLDLPVLHQNDRFVVYDLR